MLVDVDATDARAGLGATLTVAAAGATLTLRDADRPAHRAADANVSWGEPVASVDWYPPSP